MAKSNSGARRSKTVATAASARSRNVARKGVHTSAEFKLAMSSLMSDLVEGKIAPQTANAVCNAGGKLLKVVEMEYKYGRNGGKGTPDKLALTA